MSCRVESRWGAGLVGTVGHDRSYGDCRQWRKRSPLGTAPSPAHRRRRAHPGRRRFSAFEATETNDDEFVGLPLTAGTVTGHAWVLNEPTNDRPAELAGVPSNEIILIARSIDPGWVPLFGEVGGVAVDIGGDLSHGSIIVRELGLPAITNTRTGTAKLQTGDRVHLDARAGVLKRQ